MERDREEGERGAREKGEVASSAPQRAYADTNVFIRYLTGDPPELAEKSRRLFEQTAKGRIPLFMLDLVAAEIVYVLESVYRLPREDVVTRLLAIANLENLVIENRAVLLDALSLYESAKLDFTDAYIAAHMKHTGCDKLATFDTDFKRLRFIKTVL